jgi:biotin carboxyl carrier protein
MNRRVRSVGAGPAALVLLAAALLSTCQRKQGARPGEAGATEPVRLTDEQGEVGITLDSATIARIGLRTEALRSQSRAPETELPATIVPDPQATSFVRAGVSGRLASLPGIDWPTFGARVETGDSLAVIGDARPVTAPRNGLVSRVLAQPGELVQSGQELLELTSYDAPLVQVAWSAGLAEPPSTMEFAAGEQPARVRGSLAGPAPEADPVTRGPAWLYRIRGGWKGMRPGASVTGFLPSSRAAASGVLIPSAAVVQWDALAWAYLERSPGRYVRIRVPTDRPVPSGWLVSEGFDPGGRVVTTGAGQLLSEEFRARIVVGEEVGE